MSKKKLVPKLRFTGFENSNEWELYKLSELAEFNPSNQLPNKFRYVSLESVKNNFLISYEVTTIIDAPSRAQRLAKKGDIFYQTVRPYQKNNYLFNFSDPNYVFSSGYAQIRTHINEEFLFYKLMENNFVNQVLARSTGTSFPAINPDALKEIFIAIPPEKKERKVIGNFFKKIDQMIKLQQSKVNKVKDLKSAYLAGMFPKDGEKYPKKRFEGFSEQWKEYRLGKIAQIKTGNTNVQDAIPDGKYTFFDRSTDIKRIDKYYYDEETIIYPGEGSEFYPRYFRGKYALHQRAYAITSDIVNLEYLTNMMMLRNNHFVNNAVGSTVKSLRMENFTNCKVFVPSLEEQMKIAQLFNNINNQISLEEEKLSKLEKLKQAYLNDMFV